MRASRVLCLLVVFEGAAALALGACGSGKLSSGGTGGSGGSGNGGATNSSTAATLSSTATGSQCVGSSDCPNGACVGGKCCDSASVCGAACCNSGDVCLDSKCVTPGKPCHTASDCGPGKYCETALGQNPDGGATGSDDAGPVDAGSDGMVCSAPIALQGKCLDLPPVCPDGGGGPDADCFPDCEFHPPTGQLNAVPKWTWGPVASQFPNFTDVWSTPTVGRIYDDNCDGTVDELDSPVVVFVSGDVAPSNSPRDNGVLRMLDGRTGNEIWSLGAANANSKGFLGFSLAIGDLDNDGRMDIVAATGEGDVVVIDAMGNVTRTSDKGIPGFPNSTSGWGGGFEIADIDNDGYPEIGFGAAVWTTKGGGLTRLWVGANGTGGGSDEQLSTFVDLDDAPDNHLELLAGNTAYHSDGSILWNRNDLGDGFPGVGDFDHDGKPDVVLVTGSTAYILDGATGATKLGPAKMPGNGGGAPTVADFDGDGFPEIGIAQGTFYTVLKPNFTAGTLDVLWSTPNHDLSSDVTGSSVFDFEGDGKAEVIYGDECFLWVFDGQTGNVRFAASHSSFTATEASVVADVDGDGHAEILMVSNGADPSANGWGCMDANGNGKTLNGVTWVPSGQPGNGYRGIVAFGDQANSWVGTRTLWNQHTYHVSNVCDDRDTACESPNVYGSIPKVEKKNWTLPWLNDFRQNVQDKGIFDAPDAVVTLSIECQTPVVAQAAVRNIGLSALPAGVEVDIFDEGMPETQVGSATTTHILYPGQTENLAITLDSSATTKDTFVAKILSDPMKVNFRECRTDNDDSGPAQAACVH